MKPQPKISDMATPDEVWMRVRGALRAQLGGDAFQNWIDPLVFVGAEQGVLHLEAPTSFIGTWVQRNYGDTIRTLLCKDGVAVTRLEFGVSRNGTGSRLLPPGQRRRPADAPGPARGLGQ